MERGPRFLLLAALISLAPATGSAQDHPSYRQQREQASEWSRERSKREATEARRAGPRGLDALASPPSASGDEPVLAPATRAESELTFCRASRRPRYGRC